MRGKPFSGLSIPLKIRITPACAGKTQVKYLYHFRCGDHPRVCGENHLKSLPMRHGLGSPPRVRGKHIEYTDEQQRQRITPACAGKTAGERPPHGLLRDHPRVCGENRPLLCAHRHAHRITPACAGKTQQFPQKRGQHGDHPRVCGENRISEKRIPSRGGSPPRVRGKPVSSEVIPAHCRITPACAGKTIP